MSVNRNYPDYEQLRSRIRHFESTGCSRKELISAVSQDSTVNWEAIREKESLSDNWDQVKNVYKQKVIQELITPGYFKHGGDRTSAAARGAKQLAVVAYARDLALQRPLEEDDAVVADEVVDVVGQRYRGATMDATMQLRRVVRRVTRRVRTRRRNPGGVGANDDDDDDELVSEELIEEVVVRPATEPAAFASAFDPRVLGNMAPNVVCRVLDVVEKDIDTRLAIKRIDEKLEYKRINVDMVKAQTELLKVKQQAASARKRARDNHGAAEAEVDVERLVAAAWRNRRSLPGAVVAAVPPNAPAPLVSSTHALCGAVLAWVGRAGVKHTVRIETRVTPNIDIAYVNTTVDVAVLVARFWAEHTSPPPAADGERQPVVDNPVIQSPPPTVEHTATAAGRSAVDDAVCPRLLYDRAAVLAAIEFLVRQRAMRPRLAETLSGDAALPRFAREPPDAPWKLHRCAFRALRVLYGLDQISDNDGGAIVNIAQSLPGWSADWVERRTTENGKPLPLLFTGGAAMDHLKRAAEIVAAMRAAEGLFASREAASDAIQSVVLRLRR